MAKEVKKHAGAQKNILIAVPCSKNITDERERFVGTGHR
jgi:hypothetical protein